jgi:hypothetical protein
MSLHDINPVNYEIEETDIPVTGEIEMSSRFLFRAQKYCDKMNRYRRFPSYRYEIFIENNRYVVVVMQNVLVRKREDGDTTGTSEDRPYAS